MANEPVPPTPVAELAAMARTRGDDLNDLSRDLWDRGEWQAAAYLAAARDLVYTVYEMEKESTK